MVGGLNQPTGLKNAFFGPVVDKRDFVVRGIRIAGRGGKVERKMLRNAQIMYEFKRMEVMQRNLEDFLLKILVWEGGDSLKTGVKFQEKWEWNSQV